MNQQIKDELDVYACEIKLQDAKRINGLRAVFGEVSFLAHIDMQCSYFLFDLLSIGFSY